MGSFAASLLVGFVTVAQAKEPKPTKAVGIVTEVQPAQVTVRGDKGELTVQTREDFREKVAVGSQVTVWYFPKDGVNVLHWLEYPLESAFVSPEVIRAQIDKVIILPSSSVPDAEGLFDVIAEFLETRLGWWVAPRMLAEEIRDRYLKSHTTIHVIDPTTGQVDLDRYLRSQRDLVRGLASETRVDAVLEVFVEQVRVDFRSQVAVWDGVRQPVAGVTARTLSFIAARPRDGYVPAATVVLKLRDSDGRLLWTHRRGFAVLAVQVGVGIKFRDHPIPEVLEDTASVENWLELVFNSLLEAKRSERAPTAKE